MNYYKHHIGDFAEATAHLTFVEDAAYSRMLRKYYAMEKPLPADVAAVQRLVGARAKDEREAVEVVLREFFVLEGDGWHQKRADAELEEAREKAERNREIGKRGGRPRKPTAPRAPEPTENPSGRNPDGFQKETQTVSRNNPSHKPIANSQYSDPNGSGDPAPTEVPPVPPDYAAIVWSMGVAALLDTGIPERTARSFLGGLCSEWTEEQVAGAVKAAIGKADPKGYMLGVLREKPKRHDRGLRLAI